MKKCPKCRHENSEDAEYKCYECQTPFITEEEAEAMFPPGRGGHDWFTRYNEDKTKRDIVADYCDEVHDGTWQPDSTLRGWEGWLGPDGAWWPCGWQQHLHVAPVLVAYFDLKGAPKCRFSKTGGSVSTGKDGIKYYKLYPRYPDSQEILYENHWLKVTPGLEGDITMFHTGYHNEDVTDKQHETIAKWRKINDIKTIDHYDQQEKWRKEAEENGRTDISD